MSFAPPRLDFNANTYLTVYLAPASPYLSDPASIHTIHPALNHVGPVGAMQDVQIVSVPKDDWTRVSGEVLASLSDKTDIVKIEVQKEPQMRAKRAGIHRIPVDAMSSLASAAFLSHLKSLYPESARYNPWYIIAAVGYAASNRPEAIPMVLQHAMREIEGSGRDEKVLLVNRLRDAIFKGGLINGYPRAINGLKSLYDATPTELRESKINRDITLSSSEISEKGRAFYRQTYGVTADSVQSLLDTIYPDMGWFSNFVGYGIVYSYSGLLSPLETSYALCTALIATDTMRETDWHLKGAMRNGATVEGINSVRKMAIEIGKECGVVWRNEIPEIKRLEE